MPPGEPPRPQHDLTQNTSKRPFEMLSVDRDDLAATSSTHLGSLSDERSKRLRTGENHLHNESYASSSNMSHGLAGPSTVHAGAHPPNRPTPAIEESLGTSTPSPLYSTQVTNHLSERFAVFDREMDYLRSPRPAPPDLAPRLSQAIHAPPLSSLPPEGDVHPSHRSPTDGARRNLHSITSPAPISYRFSANPRDMPEPLFRADLAWNSHRADNGTIPRDSNSWLRPLSAIHHNPLAFSQDSIARANFDYGAPRSTIAPTLEPPNGHATTLGQQFHSTRPPSGTAETSMYMTGHSQPDRGQTGMHGSHNAGLERRHLNSRQEMSYGGDRTRSSHLSPTLPRMEVQTDPLAPASPASHQRQPPRVGLLPEWHVWSPLPFSLQPFFAEDRSNSTPSNNNSSTPPRRNYRIPLHERITLPQPSPSHNQAQILPPDPVVINGRVEPATLSGDTNSGETSSALPENDLLDHLVEISTSMNARLRRLELMMLNDSRSDNNSTSLPADDTPHPDTSGPTSRDYDRPFRRDTDARDPTFVSNMPYAPNTPSNPASAEPQASAQAGLHAFVNRRPQVEAARRATQDSVQRRRGRRSSLQDIFLEQRANATNEEARSAVDRADGEIRATFNILRDQTPSQTHRRGGSLSTAHRTPPSTSSLSSGRTSERRQSTIAPRLSTRTSRDPLSRPWPRRDPVSRFGAIGDFIDDDDFDASYEGLLSLAALLGDVKPRGTPKEVISRLPIATFDQWATKEGDRRCVICLEDYQLRDPVLRIPQCGHWMHKSCLEQWLHASSTCPICRTSVSGSGGLDDTIEIPTASSSGNPQEYSINLAHPLQTSRSPNPESFTSMPLLSGAIPDLPPLPPTRPLTTHLPSVSQSHASDRLAALPNSRVPRRRRT